MSDISFFHLSSRTENPPPYQSQGSLQRSPESDRDSLDDYGEGPQFNEDGSFIGEYGDEKKNAPDEKDDSALATFVWVLRMLCSSCGILTFSDPRIGLSHGEESCITGTTYFFAFFRRAEASAKRGRSARQARREKAPKYIYIYFLNIFPRLPSSRLSFCARFVLLLTKKREKLAPLLQANVDVSH